MKIRLEGTPAEVELAARQIAEAMVVIQQSRNYANRPPSKLVRRYLVVELSPALARLEPAKQQELGI